MKRLLKKSLPFVLIAALALPCATLPSCSSSKENSRANKPEMMYERHQSNKGSKVKSNIKVRGTNKKNRHTTRTY